MQRPERYRETSYTPTLFACQHKASQLLTLSPYLFLFSSICCNVLSTLMHSFSSASIRFLVCWINLATHKRVRAHKCMFQGLKVNNRHQSPEPTNASPCQPLPLQLGSKPPPLPPLACPSTFQQGQPKQIALSSL